MSFLILLYLAGFAASMPTTMSPGMTCNANMNMTVTDKWILPETVFAPMQDCKYNFFIPDGFFPILDFQSNNINMFDIVMIYSNFSYYDVITVAEGPTSFRSNLAWPVSVLTVWIRTSAQTEITISISVTAMKAMPRNKVVGSFTTYTDKPAVILYPENWIEGTSYEVNSKAGNISVNAVSIGDSYEYTKWSNLFVYEDGVLVGSMRSLTLYHKYVSASSKITLYLAKAIDLTGAVQITDYTNIAAFDRYYVSYVPIDSCDGSAWFPLSGQSASAVTVIGKWDGSNPIEIQQLQNHGDGVLSILSGGPLVNHQKAKVLDSSDLPKTFHGSSWTLYLSLSSASVKVYAPGGNITCF